MPIYEYYCPKCGTFEVLQGINDPPLDKNPKCKDPFCPRKAVRIMSACNAIFKGDGFYCTDYKTSKSQSKDKKTREDTQGRLEDKTGQKSTSAPSEKK
jgi:putative FmdB family regulatory protein